MDGKRVAILEVPAASHAPIRFQEHEYIRIGSYKKKLREFTEKERALWAKLAAASFESGIAANSLTPGEALQTLAVPKFFELLKQPAPSTEAATIDRLVEYKILARTPTPLVDVTNLGALLIGTDLNRFGLARKGVRIIEYKTARRTETLRETDGKMGYAVGFEAILRHINSAFHKMK